MTTDTLPAGYDLDLAVAEHVFGLGASQMVQMPIPCPDGMSGCCVFHTAPHFPNGARLPAYSTDIAAAWTVILHLAAADWGIQLCGPFDSGGWNCDFRRCDEEGNVIRRDAGGASAAEAICRAALLARLSGTTGATAGR